jgi:cell wall-associated NlpC family hydrolase
MRRALTGLTVAVLAVVGVGTHAYAQPSVQDIEAQINQAWNTLEPLIEQYNMVHTQLQQNQAKADALAKQMQPLQLQVDLTLTRVGAMSSRLYERGPAFKLGALLEAGSPADLADQMSTLDVLARRQAVTVQGAADLVAKYDAQKKPLDVLIAVQRQQDADLAAKKATIEKQMANLQQLRQQAYGSSGNAGGAIRPAACPFVLGTGKGAIAAKTACDQIGKPYVWAAAGPKSFDCSGLTLYAWAAAGVTLRHYTQWQWQDAKPVSRANLQPGDLVFYFSDLHHMSMYVGGNWVVHAPTSGDVVRMTQLDNPYLPIAGYRRPG